MAIVTPHHISDQAQIPAGLNLIPTAAWTLPRRDLMKSAFFLDLPLGDAVKNYGGAGAAAIVGNVTHGSDATVLNGVSGYLQTDVSETLSATIIGIVMQGDAAPIAAYGNHSGSLGLGVYTNAGGFLILNASYVAGTGGSGTATAGGSVIGVPTLFSARVPAAGPATIQNHTAGHIARTTITRDRRLRDGNQPMRVGNIGGPSWVTGKNSMMFVAEWGAVLTEAELAEALAVVRKHISYRGIAV